jgi:hypothetical protein
VTTPKKILRKKLIYKETKEKTNKKNKETVLMEPYAPP